MAQNYTRQSSFSDGDTITASLFNNEYNQLVNAFTYSSTDVDATGHRHDGTSGQGGNIYRIGDLNFLNKIEIDGSNNRLGFYVEVSSTAVEQIRIQDGVILPVTTNDIDLGSVTLQFKDGYFDGTINADSLVLSSGSTVTAVLDEDNFVSDSATALATQQSIKAYVDAQVTAQDLDFQGDTGGALSVDLDSETLTIAGGTGIDTVGATNTLTVSIDSTVATLTGTQTLTNKTIDADNNTVSNLEVDNLKTGVLDTDISAVAGTHTTLPSALAVKTYVDAQVTAQDLDIFGDTGTDAIDLDSETLTFTGGTGITSVVTAGTVTHNIDSTVATLTGTQTLTNKTLTSPDINGGTIDNAIIGGTTAAAGSFTNIVVSGTVDGRDVATDGSKLDGIEALADVTDTTNVTAAGALMDSELTNITAVKALNQGVATTDSPSFAGLTATTADINAGTIDGTVIGGSTAAAGSFTTGQFNTSLNVDGTVTADGLTVDGASVLNDSLTVKDSASPTITLTSFPGTQDTVATIFSGRAEFSGTNSFLRFGTNNGTSTLTRLNIASGGDISFYEDTGTTAKLTWSASNEFLGIGGVANARLEVLAPSTLSSDIAFFSNSTGVQKAIIRLDAQGDGEFVLRDGGNNEDVVITAGGDTYFNGGNVGIGTSSPARKLSVQGGTAGFGDGTIETIIAYSTRGIIGTQSNHDLELRTNGAIKALLDTSGNLLVGKTTAGDYVTGVEFQPAGAVLSYRNGGVAGIFGRTDGGETVRFTNNSVIVGTISTTASTTTYNTSSDQRLKENITDANDAGDKIDAIKVRQYDWKVDGSHQDYGMVAQELMTVAPEAVSGDPESDDMMGVDYSKLVPMMLKEIQSLRARVAQLEGAN